jgi:hypothetical protein
VRLLIDVADEGRRRPSNAVYEDRCNLPDKRATPRLTTSSDQAGIRARENAVPPSQA